MTTTEELYTHTRICRETGIPSRQLIYLNDLGAVEPVVKAGGKGSRRKYTFRDVVAVRLFRLMTDAGLEFKRAVEIIKSRDIMSGGVLRFEYPVQVPVVTVIINIDPLLSLRPTPVEQERITIDSDRAKEWKLRLMYADLTQRQMCFDLRMDETRLSKFMGGWSSLARDEVRKIEEYLPPLTKSAKKDLDRMRRRRTKD